MARPLLVVLDAYDPGDDPEWRTLPRPRGGDRIGWQGKRADLVLIDGTLAQNPAAIERMQLVFKAGVGYAPGAIRTAYAGKVGID